MGTGAAIVVVVVAEAASVDCSTVAGAGVAGFDDAGGAGCP